MAAVDRVDVVMRTLRRVLIFSSACDGFVAEEEVEEEDEAEDDDGVAAVLAL